MRLSRGAALLRQAGFICLAQNSKASFWSGRSRQRILVLFLTHVDLPGIPGSATKRFWNLPFCACHRTAARHKIVAAIVNTHAEGRSRNRLPSKHWALGFDDVRQRRQEPAPRGLSWRAEEDSALRGEIG